MSDKEENQSFGSWLSEPQTMIGLSAIILSICGLFISFYEASIIREHQRASVWPNVEIGPSFISDQLGFHITNTGIGPAKIEAVNVTYKNKVMQSWDDLLTTVVSTDTSGEKPIQFNFFRSRIKNDVLPTNSEREYIFRISVEDNKDNKTAIGKFMQETASGNVNITVCYCSVYDECWITTMLDDTKADSVLAPGTQRPIASCKDAKNSNI